MKAMASCSKQKEKVSKNSVALNGLYGQYHIDIDKTRKFK